MLRLAAEPKRWISVTAPPWPSSAGELGGVQQVARDCALHHLQHRRDELRLRGQQHAQRDRQGQHPLHHRDVRDDVIDQVRRCLRHALGAARRAEPAPLAAEGQQLVVAALAAA
jgi:hypothetical protein